jgi:hypothetical protein
MNVGEIIFAPREGETPQQTEDRQKEAKGIFQAALNNAEGKALLALLKEASHPMGPRFMGDGPEQAAFRDGEKSLIGLLWLNGLNDL